MPESIEQIFAGERNEKMINKAVDWFIDHQEAGSLLQFLSSRDPDMNLKASQVLARLTDRAPALLTTHLSAYAELLHMPLHISVKRIVLRLFNYQSLPNSKEGETMDQCFRYLTSRKDPTAVKVFAMTVIYFYTQKYPELLHELLLTLEGSLDYESAGFRNRAGKILSGTLKMPPDYFKNASNQPKEDAL